jgi:hypothetical protein
MYSDPTASATARRAAHKNRHTRLKFNGAPVIGTFLVSLASTLAGGFFLAGQLTEQSVSLSSFLRSPFLWPLIAMAGAITLAAGIAWTTIARAMAHREYTRASDATRPVDQESTEQSNATRHAADDLTHRLLRLTSNAERLTGVEHDLARKIVDGSRVDSATRRLMAEMQICTNRMLGQLSELSRSQGCQTTGSTGGDTIREKAH